MCLNRNRQKTQVPNLSLKNDKSQLAPMEIPEPYTKDIHSVILHSMLFNYPRKVVKHMKEIKIVLNKDDDALVGDLKSAIQVFVDGKKLENVESITIEAHQPDRDVVDKDGICRLDKLVSYTVKYIEPWFD